MDIIRFKNNHYTKYFACLFKRRLVLHNRESIKKAFYKLPTPAYNIDLTTWGTKVGRKNSL